MNTLLSCCGFLFITCIADMHFRKPVWGSFEMIYFVRKAQYLYSTYQCVPLLDVKVWSLQQKWCFAPATLCSNTLEWRDNIPANCCPTNAQKGPKSCHFRVWWAAINIVLLEWFTVQHYSGAAMSRSFAIFNSIVCLDFLFAVYTNVSDAEIFFFLAKFLILFILLLELSFLWVSVFK